MAHLIFTGKKYSARLVRGGQLIPLHTDNKHVAAQRLDALLAGEPVPGAPSDCETLKEASVRIVEALRQDGMRTANQRLSRLRTYVWPTLGKLPVNQIKSGQISEVLAAAAATGLSHQTIKHLQVDLGRIFGELVRDEVLENNPARAERLRIPRGTVDKRRRTLLTDAEFEALIGCVDTPREIRTMAVVSRCFGGLRPSDIYAWTWGDIDIRSWQWADAPRPKTEHHAEADAAPRERIELPPLVADWLNSWWRDTGRPAPECAVFPHHHANLARSLRRALRTAGVDRHEVHHDTERSLKTDFYCFRRSFVTAMATSGVNAQLAMRATGHRSMTTHQRYIVNPTIVLPASAMPGGEDRAPDTIPAPPPYPTDDLEWDQPTDPNVCTIPLVRPVAELLDSTEEATSQHRPPWPQRTTPQEAASCQDETFLLNNGEELMSVRSGTDQ